MISAPGLLVGSGMGTRLWARGFLRAEPRARLRKIAHTGAPILSYRGGDRVQSSTRRWQLRTKNVAVRDSVCFVRRRRSRYYAVFVYSCRGNFFVNCRVM